jgi:DeoR family transcriptional regulator of aga operon
MREMNARGRRSMGELASSVSVETLADEQTAADAVTRDLMAAERRARIADLLRHKGFVRIKELCHLFDVSQVTIRGDLDFLAGQGVLTRERGGAIANTRASLLTAFDQRAGLNLDEKRRIGQAAARLVLPGDTIIMDAGTTVMELAKSLGDVSPLTVITNALNVAARAGSLPDVHVILVGGSLSRETISTIGPHAERDLNDFVVQKVFLGTHAFDAEAGLTDLSIELAHTKRAMVRAAREVILLADSSKWGRVALAKVVPLSSVHTVITDSGMPTDARAAMERLGINLIVV